jgi:hypothetical protein
MGKANNEAGFFEAILMLVGGFSGALYGFEQGEWVGLIIGALVLGIVGKWVGAVADWLVKLIVLVGFILLNAAARQFVWELINSLLDQI